MSKRKGLGFDEKKTRLLSLLQDSNSFFLLKDLEKLAQKEKGIVSNTVKDVLDALVSDSLVTMEKIGTSNYFWSFKNQSTAILLKQKSSLETLKSDLVSKLSSANDACVFNGVGREVSDERSLLLLEYEKFSKLVSDMQKDLDFFKDCDPEVLQHKKNILLLKSHFTRKLSMSGSEVNKALGIPEDLDTFA